MSVGLLVALLSGCSGGLNPHDDPTTPSTDCPADELIDAYQDADADGFTNFTPIPACEDAPLPPSYQWQASTEEDCDDNNNTYYPGAPERVSLLEYSNDCRNVTGKSFDFERDGMFINFDQWDIANVDEDPEMELVGTADCDLHVIDDFQSLARPGLSFGPENADFIIGGADVCFNNLKTKDLNNDFIDDIVITNSSPFSTPSLIKIPGPITESRNIDGGNLANNSYAVANNIQVITDYSWKFYLTPDIDTYQTSAGEIIFDNETSYLIQPATFLPGSSVLNPFDGYILRMYSASTSMTDTPPVVTDLNADGTGDLVVGDESSNCATLIHGGPELISQVGSVLQVSPSDTPLSQHADTRIQDTSLEYTIFKGHEETGALKAGSLLIAEDIDADGQQDLIIGVYDEHVGPSSDAGCFYNIYGASYMTDFNSPTRVVEKDLNGDVFAIGGTQTCGSQTGQKVGLYGGAGDFNGDGFADTAVSSTSDNTIFMHSGSFISNHPGESISVSDAQHIVNSTIFLAPHKSIKVDEDMYGDLVFTTDENSDVILFGGN